LNVDNILRAEKAFPEDVTKINRDKGAQSSLERWSVFDTKDDMAEYDRGSRFIQVGWDRLEHID
jgi:hypothetical protein